MTAADLVDLLQARRVGPGRWMGPCPAHKDRTPSVSIREGREGVALIHCFAGCATTSILAAVGLRFSDLFSDSHRSPTQLRVSKSAREELARAAREERRARLADAEQIRQLHNAVKIIGARLAVTPDDAADGERLTGLFHSALSKLQEAESGRNR